MQNQMPMTTDRSKSKPEVEFQYGGRSFSQTGIVITQPWVGLRYLYEIWSLRDPDLPSTCTLPNWNL